MTYRVEENFKVVEKDTDLIVQVCRNSTEARQLCRSLNLGAGFNGFTPEFFNAFTKQKERLSRELDNLS